MMKALDSSVLLAAAVWMTTLSNRSAPLCSAFVPLVKPIATTTLTKNLNHPSAAFSPKTVPVALSQPCVSSCSTTTALSSSLLFSNVAAVKNVATLPAVRRALLTLVAALAVVFRKRILWPGAVADESVPEPLPPGTYGCPFLGYNIMASSPDYGYGIVVRKLFRKLGRPKLFKFFGLGRPFVSVTGKEEIQAVTKNEFGGGVNMIDIAKLPYAMEVFGKYSVLYENDRDKHAQLRRLVGVAMTPKALEAAVPLIQDAAEHQVSKHIVRSAGAGQEDDDTDPTVTMFGVHSEFTLDIAWKQILGLDLEGPEEIAEFHLQVQNWLDSVQSVLFFMPFKLPWFKRTKGYKAKQYLVKLVEKKLDKLDREGPDGSTLSDIYFATDEDGVTRLPRQVVMDNAMILIVAGTATSSSTLTTAMLLLGLHPDYFRELQEEQRSVITKHGTWLTKDILDNECPYLEACIKETMRLRPFPALELRRTDSTLIVDGQQIPKKWSLWLNVRATHDQDPVCRVNDNDDHMDVGKGFKPERWLEAKTRPVDYLPWGEGARRCLGERLAMVEMKVFLATVARNLESFRLVGVDCPEDVKWKAFSATPYPEDGVVIQPAAAFAANAASSPRSTLNSTAVPS